MRKSTTARGGVIYSQAGGAPAERPALTAAALACMLTTGDLDSEYARKWLKYCQETLPIVQPDAKMGSDEYLQYYYAQALYILGDTGYAKLFPGSKPAEQLTWSKYRESTFDTILSPGRRRRLAHRQLRPRLRDRLLSHHPPARQ